MASVQFVDMHTRMLSERVGREKRAKRGSPKASAASVSLAHCALYASQKTKAENRRDTNDQHTTLPNTQKQKAQKKKGRQKVLNAVAALARKRKKFSTLAVDKLSRHGKKKKKKGKETAQEGIFPFVSRKLQDLFN